ncbi:hypothetical protein BDW75DRAFT_76984 [Aspergillus navahoensis]
MFKWLSPLNPSARHVEYQKTRVKGTGTWMLEDHRFLDWSSTTGSCQTLCCYGAAGAGKTIITSLVIDELQRCIAQEPKLGLVYIYFNYSDQKEQTTENILGTFLKQLLGILPEIPEAVLNLYGDQASRGNTLSLTDAVYLLRITCAQFTNVYVCLDALDELGDLQGLLHHLCDRPSSVKIFITGRDRTQDTVQKYFKVQQRISIHAHKNDIRQFIEHEIGGSCDAEPDAMDEKLRKNILEKVVNSAEGIFLLPALHIRSILEATTIRDRKEALKTLPASLGEAFAKNLTRIDRQLDALVEKAKKIIAWIHLAERPLTVDELLCSLAIRDGETFLDHSGIPIRKTLLKCCHGLAVIDQETSTVRLVHYSLQEYLTRQERMFGLTKAHWHSKIAQTCLIFLRFPSERAEQIVEENSTAISLLHYAATQWGHHLRKCEQCDVPDRAAELAIEYLSTSFETGYKSFHLLYQVMYSYVYYVPPDEVFPAHIVAFFGITQIMSYIIETGEVDMDSEDSIHRTPLSWAAEKGHEAVVKLLLKTGKMDVDCKDSEYHRTPLSLAAEKGHEAVVKLLLKTGKVDVDSEDSRHQTPLSWAAGMDIRQC